MIGMGDSDPLPNSGPGKYTFQTHRDYLFELLEKLGLGNRVTFIVHDWGSGIGFHRAQQNPSRVKGLVYMEAIPPGLVMPVPTGGRL
jgi:haloalkane dehalogenase